TGENTVARGRLTEEKKVLPVDGEGASCCNRRLPFSGAIFRPQAAGRSMSAAPGSHHETHLPSLQGPPRPHARISRPHEVAWRPGGDQRPARQGAQAPGGLTVPARPERMPGRLAPAAPPPRLTASADFERVLGRRSRSVTPH